MFWSGWRGVGGHTVGVKPYCSLACSASQPVHKHSPIRAKKNGLYKSAWLEIDQSSGRIKGIVQNGLAPAPVA